MVNRLYLSPLAAEAPHSAETGPHPLAAGSFALLAGLFLVAMGIQFFGDPSGGAPRASLTLDEDAPMASAAAPRVMDVEVPDVARVDTGAIRVLNPENENDLILSGEDVVATIQIDSHTPLSPAPISMLLDYGEYGPVPQLGPNGERASEVYARPYENPEDLPRIALVIGGLGLNDEATQNAIDTLPGEVTLSFVPYAENLQNWIDLAREMGHEVIVELPLEPFDYPNNDPGPATLLTDSTPEDNAIRLSWIMSRAGGYVGLMNYQGARMTASTRAFAPVLQEIADRGLLYLDDGTSPRSQAARIGAETGGPWAVASRRIDSRRNGPAITSALRHLETAAIEDGVAIGVGFAYPVTVDEIMAWVDTLAVKGFSLAPLSAATQEPTPDAGQVATEPEMSQ